MAGRVVASGISNPPVNSRSGQKTVARRRTEIFTRRSLPFRAAATAYAYHHGLL